MTDSPPSYEFDHTLLVDEDANQKARYTDRPWTFLFILHQISLVVIFGISLGSILSEDYDSDFGSLDGDTNWLIGRCVLTLVAGFVFAGIVGFTLIRLMRAFTRPYVIVSLVGVFVLLLVLGILSIAGGSIFFGILLILIAVIWGALIRHWRHKIPFAVLILKTVSNIVLEYTATIWTAFLVLFFEGLWLAFWITTLVLLIMVFLGTAEGLLIWYLIFSLYWTIQVMKNVIHVSACGLFATWYFQQSDMPSNPTKKALKRALSTSFGSICLGSLVVSLIQTVRTIFNVLRGNGLCGVCFDCCFRCIEWIMEYFNNYAFAQVAIYGKTFCEAAKSTYALFKRTRLLNLVNDSILSPVLTLSIYGAAVLVGIVVGVLSVGTVDAESSPGFGVAGGLIGLVVVSLVLQVVDSGVVCLFVCLSEDPAALRNNNQDLYNEFLETWPDLATLGQQQEGEEGFKGDEMQKV